MSGMNVDGLRKVGAGEWADYAKPKRNIYKSNGSGTPNLDIRDPRMCITSFTHKHDILFGNCKDCCYFATDFMLVIDSEVLELDYIRQIPTQSITTMFDKKGIKDNTKSRNKIFKMLVDEYVNHIECKHPELVVAT